MPTKRRLRVAALLLAGLALASSPVWATRVGKRIDWLTVRRVEITGTRLLAPSEVLAASRIATGQHLLDETALSEQALLEHPVIADAAISRRPPHTLAIHIIEKSPVALVEAGTLRLATAAGEILPVDPHAAALDLPVVHGELEDPASAEATRRALAETDRLSRLAPALMREVSEVRISGEGPGVLTLVHGAGEVLLPVGVPAARLEELRRILADVERRFPVPPSKPGRPRHRIDLRFEDQVVVRPSYSGERS